MQCHRRHRSHRYRHTRAVICGRALRIFLYAQYNFNPLRSHSDASVRNGKRISDGNEWLGSHANPAGDVSLFFDCELRSAAKFLARSLYYDEMTRGDDGGE